MAVFAEEITNSFHRTVSLSKSLKTNVKELLKFVDVQNYSTVKMEKQELDRNLNKVSRALRSCPANCVFSFYVSCVIIII